MKPEYLHQYLHNAIAEVSAMLYGEYTGQPKAAFAPRPIEADLLRWLTPLEYIGSAWQPPNPIGFADDPVQLVIEELQNAAIEPWRLGGFYCQMDNRAGWTTKPRHIANELNASRLYAGVIYPQNVVIAQQKLGVWERRKNIDQWELAAIS